MENVAILLRQSTKKQAKRRSKDEVDIPGQRREIEAYLASKPNWCVVREYIEEGVSAFKKSAEERDVLQRAHRDAESGAWSILIVFKHDRLSRRPVDYLKGLERFEAAGIKVWSVADNKWLSMDDDEIILRFMEGYVANRSSKDTAQRVAPRMRQLARDGRWTGGHTPYGYDLKPKVDAAGGLVMRGDRVVRELVPNHLAVYVREIYDRFLEGQGPRQIAQWLNTCPDSLDGKTEWSDRSVRLILQNAIYCGWVPYLHGQIGRKSGEQPILAPGKHEAIVSRQVWDSAQAIIRLRANVPRRQRTHTYVLTGLARCGLCGGALGGVTRGWRMVNGKPVAKQAYRCLRRFRGGRCNSPTMNCSIVDTNFITALEQSFAAPTGLLTFLEQQTEAAQEMLREEQAARRRMQERLKEIEGALRRLDRAYFEAGTVNDVEYAQKKGEYQEERRGLEAELAKPLTQPEDKDVAALVALVQQLRDNWYDPETTPAERKLIALSIVKSWGLKVLVHPDKRVEILPE